MASNLNTIAFAVTAVTHSLSVILNTLGICLLSNLYGELTNQRIFLMNLSIAEILYASGTMSYYAIDNYAANDVHETIFFAILRGLSWVFYYLYLVSPLVLTIDRLICIVFPWRYIAISTRSRAIMVVFSTWICVLLIALPSLLITDYNTARGNHLSAVALGIEVTVASFAIIAYTLIGMTVYRRGNAAGRTNIQTKILKVATIIIITYFILETIPSMVLTVLFSCCRDFTKAYRRLFYLPSGFNTISDPIIYLYNYPPLKAALKEKLRCVVLKLKCTWQRSPTEDASRPILFSDKPVYESIE